MGHYVNYVIDCGIDKTLSVIDPESKKYYLSLSEEDQQGLIEANLKDTELNINIDCGSNITILCVSQIKWSWLIKKDKDALSTIELYDSSILSLFRGYEILKVDELLIDEWESTNYELHESEHKAFTDFQAWLKTQETLHWVQLS